MKRSSRPRILALIQAGGKGSRLDVLTRERPKPALPFAGTYHLIDFPLSNLRNSGVDDVWLSVQYLGQPLAELVAGGKPWDLDRHHGGFQLLMPQEGGGAPAEDGFASGNAEDLFAQRDRIREHDPDVVLVLSSDHVYSLDYRDVVAQHLANEADCTIVTTQIGIDEAHNHATVQSNKSGKVTKFAYKPEKPRTGTIATEVFCYSPEPLLQTLEELHRDLAGRPEPDPEGLGDFGDRLIPALLKRGKVFSYKLPGYWRDLGRPETYLAAHHDLLQEDLDIFNDSDWPIRTNQPQLLPAQVHGGAKISGSLLSPGCVVHGTVTNSVLGPGVTVAAGAVVADSVLNSDVTVDSGARVHWSVIDDGTRLGGNATVGRKHRGSDRLDPDLITLVGRDCQIDGDVARGARVEPGSVL